MIREANAPCFLFIVAFFFAGFFASAQVDNSYLSDHIQMHEVDSNKGVAGVSVNAFTYLRNTEYFNKIEQGRTLFGYQLNPSLYYQPNASVKIATGVFVRNDFGGRNPYTDVIPTFTIKTAHTKFTSSHSVRTFSMIAGTLEGALTHRMLEPMFNIASAIERRVENGFEMKVESYADDGNTYIRNFYDLWINWEKFIERGSPYKEVFTAGVNIQPRSIADKIYVYPVVQDLLTHHGGQIDSDTLHPMTMQANTALGLKSDIDIASHQALVAEVYMMNYRETTRSGLLPFGRGNAFYAGVAYRWGNKYLVKAKKPKAEINVMLNYWRGNNFIAPRGTTIYQSRSIDDPTYFERRRTLIFVRLFYDRLLFNQLYMSARIEPFYDVGHKQVDYSFSFYLSYKTDLNFRKK